MPEEHYEDVRRLLDRVASEAPAFAPMPERTVRRARRRAGTTMSVISLAIVAAVVVGLRSLPANDDAFVDTPTPTGVSPGDEDLPRGLYAVDLATGEPALVAVPPEGVEGFFVSYQGGRVAYLSDVDGYPQIFVMNADGSEPIQVTDGLVGRWLPVWSPDGTHLAYVGWAPDGSYEVYTIDVESQRPRQLTSERNDVEQSPAWSSDGRSIVFQTSGREDRPSSPTRIVRSVDITSGVTTTLVTDAGVPDPSPDGTRIVFDTWSAVRVTVANMDGFQRTTIPTSGDAVYPKWSPDSERIAFVLGTWYDPGQFHVGTVVVYDLATDQVALSVPGFLVDWLDEHTILVWRD